MFEKYNPVLFSIVIFISIFFFASFALANEGANGEAEKTRVPDITRIIRDLEYVPGGHERQKLDLYLPPRGEDSAPLPLIVWVHGGAWLGGNKNSCPAAQFLKDGFAAASINYRLSQHAIFPAQIEDCKAAIRFLRANAGQHRQAADRRHPVERRGRPADPEFAGHAARTCIDEPSSDGFPAIFRDVEKDGRVFFLNVPKRKRFMVVEGQEHTMKVFDRLGDRRVMQVESQYTIKFVDHGRVRLVHFQSDAR